MKVSVLGCGRWGSCIAWYLDKIGHEVLSGGLADAPEFKPLAEWTLVDDSNYVKTDSKTVSAIYVNGEKQSTQFLNNTRIELKKCELKEGDIIVVNQVGSSSRIFRSSVEYAYSQGKLVLASEYVEPIEETPEGEVPEGESTDVTPAEATPAQ